MTLSKVENDLQLGGKKTTLNYMRYVILSHVGVKSLIEQSRGMLIHDSPAKAITLKLILFTFKCIIKAIL